MTISPYSFIKLHSMVHPRATTEFIYRYNDAQRAQVFLSFQLSSTNREKEVADLLAQLQTFDMRGTDISDNELAKSHARYMIGGRVKVPNERLFRFGEYTLRNQSNRRSDAYSVLRVSRATRRVKEIFGGTSLRVEYLLIPLS